MSVNEAIEVDVGLADYLKADALLTSYVGDRIYSTFIGKASDPLPIVRYFQVESDDLPNVWGGRVWTEFVYQVEAIARVDQVNEASAIAGRLDALLHLVRNVDLGNVLLEEAYRRAPLFRRTTEGGDSYLYAGGEFVLHVTA